MAKLTKEQLLKKFCLPADCNKQYLRKACSSLLLQAHPDQGGDATKFQSLLVEYQQLMELLPECSKCNDEKYIVQGNLRRLCECQKKKRLSQLQ